MLEMDGLINVVIHAVQQYIAQNGFQLQSREERSPPPPKPNPPERHCWTCRCVNSIPVALVQPIRPSPPLQLVQQHQQLLPLDEGGSEEEGDEINEGGGSEEESGEEESGSEEGDSAEEFELEEDFAGLRPTQLSPPPRLPTEEPTTSYGAPPHRPRLLGHRRLFPTWEESDSEEDEFFSSSDQPPPKRVCISGVSTPPARQSSSSSGATSVATEDEDNVPWGVAGPSTIPMWQASSSSGATSVAIEDEDTVPWGITGPSTTPGQVPSSSVATSVAIEDEQTNPWEWRMADLLSDQGSSFSLTTPEDEDDLWELAGPSTTPSRQSSSSIAAGVAIEDEDTFSLENFIDQLARCVD